jgi:hypothetical protein
MFSFFMKGERSNNSQLAANPSIPAYLAEHSRNLRLKNYISLDMYLANLA